MFIKLVEFYSHPKGINIKEFTDMIWDIFHLLATKCLKSLNIIQRFDATN